MNKSQSHFETPWWQENNNQAISGADLQVCLLKPFCEWFGVGVAVAVGVAVSVCANRTTHSTPMALQIGQASPVLSGEAPLNRTQTRAASKASLPIAFNQRIFASFLELRTFFPTSKVLKVRLWAMKPVYL